MKRIMTLTAVLVAVLALHIGCKKKEAEAQKEKTKQEAVKDEKPTYSKKDVMGCAGNLKKMAFGLLMYSGDYSGFFPLNFEEVAKEDYLKPGKEYVCPADDKKAPTTAAEVAKGQSSYEYIGSGIRDDNSDARLVPVARCACGKHGPLGVPTLYVDGHVEILKKDKKDKK